MPTAAYPIRRVRRDGSVDELGLWRPEPNVLDLGRAGFPLLGPGSHRVDGDLPWVFEELAPDGFLAARFARWFPELHLPPDRTRWRPEDVVRAVAERGHDLPGNLLVGEASLERYRRIFQVGTKPGPARGERETYPVFVDDLLRPPGHSSVGGARPKFALRLADGGGLIVKFTPPLDQPAGRRWSDLLRMEAHATRTLAEAGFPVVRAEYLELAGRGFLEIDRFDRLPGGGRVGHVTLYWLGAALYGEAADPPRVVDALVRDGHLPPADGETFRRIDAFARAIADTDRHQGNYGLVIDDDGGARLAPAYDVVPMAFAPRHDELPDRLVEHVAPTDDATRALVERLVARVEADGELSDAFRDAWRRAVE